MLFAAPDCGLGAGVAADRPACRSRSSAAGAAVVVRDMVTLDASFIAALIGGRVPGAAAGRRDLRGLPRSARLGRAAAAPSAGGQHRVGVLGRAGGSVDARGDRPAECPWPTPDVQDAPAIALAGAVLLARELPGHHACSSTVVWRGHEPPGTASSRSSPGLAPASLVLVAVGDGDGAAVRAVRARGAGAAGAAGAAAARGGAAVCAGARVRASWTATRRDRPVRARDRGRPRARRRRRSACCWTPPRTSASTKRLTRIEDFERVMQTVLYCRERWDGRGGFPRRPERRGDPGREPRAGRRRAAGRADRQRGRAGSPRARRSHALRAARGHGVRPARRGRGALGDRGGHPGVGAAPRQAARRLLGFGSSQSRPAGRIRSTRSPSAARRARLARPSGAAPTTWQAPRRRRR